MKPPKTMPLALLLALCALMLALCPRAARADNWYQPVAGDFRPLYDRDSADQKYQSWDGRDSYWHWVQTFYNGYKKRVLGISVVREVGWTARSRDLASHIASEPARRELALSLNALGRDIAGEWAKNDHACRIHTGDLRRWRDKLSQAQGHDSGSGQVISSAVRAIQAEVDTRLQGRR